MGDTAPKLNMKANVNSNPQKNFNYFFRSAQVSGNLYKTYTLRYLSVNC